MKDLVNSGVNIVAFEKNGHKYGMTCAWMMQVDEDQLLMLLGSQSETANRIEEDDVIGISSLALGQEEIAELFGTKHSRKVNKFAKILYEEERRLFYVALTRCKEYIYLLTPKTSPSPFIKEIKTTTSKL